MGTYRAMVTHARNERLPLYQQLRDALVKKISSKSWSVGETIPSEEELTIQYNVSSGTVRKAVDLLVAEGVLERMRGRGIYVKRPQFSSSLFRFFHFRGLYDERVVPESQITHRRVYEAPEDVRQVLHLSEKALVIHFSRLRLVDGDAVITEEIWLPYYKFNVLVSLALDEFGLLLYPLYEDKCGQSIAYVEESILAESAAVGDATRLNIEENSSVLVIERVAFDSNKHPLEWRVSKCATKKIRYRTGIY